MVRAAPDVGALRKAHVDFLKPLYESNPKDVLPARKDIRLAESEILTDVPDRGRGEAFAINNLRKLSQGFNKGSTSANYYGFVTGGANPVASVADAMVSVHDQNVQVHLPKETVATTVEAHALKMLCELVNLDPNSFRHRTFTTGATASNVLGVTCGREYVISKAAQARGVEASVGNDGLLAAMKKADLDEIQVLTTVPHSSLAKAASIAGLGRDSVRSVARDDVPHEFDLGKLGEELRRPRTASIVVVSCGEVNTGFFATDGATMTKIRSLCDEVGAYIHCDGAFGLMGRCLTDSESSPQARYVKDACAGIELCDSITGDGHKLLNVPYDCGFFFSRSVENATNVFQNAGAAYLRAAPTASNDANPIPSPLNIGIENSRRFRALPVYASLVAYGRDGYADMLRRQMEVALGVARIVEAHEMFELLQRDVYELLQLTRVYVVVLFRAADDEFNDELVRRINGTRRMYVSGTMWEGKPAARIAVSNWKANAARDVPLVTSVLQQVCNEWVRDLEV